MNSSRVLTHTAAALLAVSVAHQEARLPARSPVLPVVAPEVAVPPPHVHGRSRMLHAPTPCDVPAFGPGGPGAPYFVTSGIPRAGVPFRVDWTTKPTKPGPTPVWPAILLISMQPSVPTPLASVGGPGCYLMVQPDHIMVPQPGSILTQQGGRVRLDWTPPHGLVGTDFYAQLLVNAAGINAGGFLVSPALHVQIGS